ncbi:MAG: hypothetical protein ABIJ85_02605 [bacterium]
MRKQKYMLRIAAFVQYLNELLVPLQYQSKFSFFSWKKGNFARAQNCLFARVFRGEDTIAPPRAVVTLPRVTTARYGGAMPSLVLNTFLGFYFKGTLEVCSNFGGNAAPSRHLRWRMILPRFGVSAVARTSDG